MTDTIFAVSSGALPSAIAIIRISGPAALLVGAALAGTLPTPRRASVRTLRDAAGDVLDRGVMIVFPGPMTATGEDVIELHVHGSRAVVAAVERVLAAQPDTRAAEAGEFTRRALLNGRIDLTQAEGLADLLVAETEAARRVALAASEGAVSQAVAHWNGQLVTLSARLEAQIDYADEDDVAADIDALAVLSADIASLRRELTDAAARPPVERLRDGIRVVFAGPPNSGKSSLINALVERDVAIATPIAGTTRDVIEVPVTRNGIAWLLTDGAGLRDDSHDPVELIGIARIRAAIERADVVLRLGDEAAPIANAVALHPRSDQPERAIVPPGRLSISAATGEGIGHLWDALAEHAAAMLPAVGVVAFNQRQVQALMEAASVLEGDDDPILLSEQLRLARRALAELTHGADVEQVLDALFAGFCIGK